MKLFERMSIAGAAVAITAALAMTPVEKTSNQRAPAPQGDESRLAKLEKRIERVEDILLNSMVLNVYNAERRADKAQAELQKSKRLFMQGLISQIELTQDRYAFDRAKRELQLAKAREQGRIIAREIDVMEAKRKFENAKHQLRLSERILNRGHLSPERIEQDAERVEARRRELEFAKQRLRAAEELEQEHSPAPLNQRPDDDPPVPFDGQQLEQEGENQEENEAGDNQAGGNDAGENDRGENDGGENDRGENNAGANDGGENDGGADEVSDN